MSQGFQFFSKILYEKESFLHWLVLDHVLGSHQIGLAFLSQIKCQAVKNLIVGEIYSVVANSLEDFLCFNVGLKRFHHQSQALHTHFGLDY